MNHCATLGCSVRALGSIGHTRIHERYSAWLYYTDTVSTLDDVHDLLDLV